MGRGVSTLQSLSVPAPSGINTVDPIMALPAGDCVYAWNLVSSEFGLRARSGWKEWCTNINSGGEVRSVLPFVGSQASGGTNKLFAVSNDGIYDVTASSAAPTRVVVFGYTGGASGSAVGLPSGATTGDAGFGQSCVFSVPGGGRYLVYCDEVNGAYLYTESPAGWTKLRAGASVFWTPSTVYILGSQVINGANSYVATTGGTSAGAGGPTGQGTGIADGSVVWKFLEGAWTPATTYAVGCQVTNGTTPKRVYQCTTGGASAGAGGPSGTGTGIVDNVARWSYVCDYSVPIGASYADQQLGFTAAPENWVFPVAWKSRLWMVDKDTTAAWFGGVTSLFGTFTRQDFGSRMRAGGPLMGLANWSYDAGGGLDTLLVAVGLAGDVVIYAGTDPTSASTFGLKGSWAVGPLPKGRRQMTDFGGDLLLLSAQGVVPLSKLVTGQPVVNGDRSVYATGKVGNAFTAAVATYRTLPGWGLCLHPDDNALLVLVPPGLGQASQPFVMGLATRGWTRYRDIPMYSAGVFDNILHVGTLDGRVLQVTGYTDGQKLGATETSPIQWAMLTGYSTLGTTKQKRMLGIRVNVMTSGGATIAAAGKTRLDTQEIGFPPFAPAGGSASWDTAVWDAAKWDGGMLSVQNFQGAAALGRELAVAVAGVSTGRTILAGLDVQYDVGGDL